MTKKSDKSKFEQEYKYYFQKKQFNAREIIKNEPAYVDRLGRDYYEIISRYIKSYDYEKFFEWLAQSEQYLIDESQLVDKCYQWNQRKPVEKYDDVLPEAFQTFLKNIWGALQICGHPIFTKASPIISWFDHRQNRIEWKKKNEKEQFTRLWDWLKSILTINQVSIIEINLKRFEDITGDIRQRRINGEDIAVAVSKLFVNIPKAIKDSRKMQKNTLSAKP